MECDSESRATYPEKAKETAQSLKQRGNEHFVAGRYTEAIECYSRAIDMSASSHVLFGNRSAAHGGLGAWKLAAADARTSVELEPGYTKGFYRLAQALIAMGDFAEAASVVEDGLRVDPKNREMSALKRKVARGGTGGQQSNKGEAAEDPAAAAVVAAAAAAAPRKSARRINLGRAGLYDDKELPDTPQEGSAEAGEAGSLKELFSSLRDSVAACDSGNLLERDRVRHELDGMFSKLIEPEQFRRIALPRLSEEERRRAPSSLQELLRTPLYASALEQSLPRVVSTAASVLEGVKRRGKEQGDIMDAATEEALKPQVLQEAFAREVISVITTVQTKARAQAVLDRGKLASPTCEEASWDQLHDVTVADLSKEGKSFAVQDSFLGDEWVTPLLEDSLRFGETGKLHHLGVEREHGEMAWVEADQLEYGYPALHELVANLHALAFELNLKEPGMGLGRPFQGSTMLLRLTERCRVPVRLDSVAGGVETGHTISAVYFVGRCTTGGSTADPAGEARASEGHGLSASTGANAGGGQLTLQNIEAATPLAGGVDESSSSGSGDGVSGGGSPTAATDGNEKEDEKDGTAVGNTDGEAAAALHPPAPSGSGTDKNPPRRRAEGVVLEPTADRLVLFRSDRVSTETLEVLGKGQEQYVVLFWMHGAKEGVGEVAGGMIQSPSS